jgi:amino acid transporter
VIANFSLSIVFVSIFSGVAILYGIGLRYGGPISMVYGWIISGIFNHWVALSMAEICSAYPTSGGLYYWSYALAGPKWGPFAAWLTGW